MKDTGWSITGKRVGHYTVVLAVVWTLCVCGSLAWGIMQLSKTAMELAKTQARAAHEKDVLYRKWNAAHGGVYVPVSEKASSNPYLETGRRDRKTEEGEALTLINPAYMTRQLHEIQEEESGTKGHLTSLNPIRPENAADAWETRALKAFERGAKEVSSLEIMSGQEYLRLMRPLFVEETCLECHAVQGYELGDIRGGISVSIPMGATWHIIRKEQLQFAGLLLSLGILGLGVLSYGGRKLHTQVNVREEAEDELRNTHSTLRRELDERRRVEEQLLQIRAAVEDASDAVVIFERDGAVLFINMAFGELLGYTADSVKSQGVGSLFSDSKMATDVFQEALQGIIYSSEVELVNAKGEVFPALLRATAIMDEAHEIHGVLFILTDITERKKLENELRRIAAQDGLTQTANRRTFDQSLEKEWRRTARSGQPLSLIMMDIDFFKKYNDTYGHHGGDTCLKEVAAALREVVNRPGDLVARYGGEEFAAILPETQAEGALSLAQAMCRAVEALHIEHAPSDVSSWVTVSVGHATIIPRPEDTPTHLIELADSALYDAKEGGRNRVFPDNPPCG